MRLSIRCLTAATAASLALLGFAASAVASDAAATVRLGHNRVEPAQVEVEPGAVVRFHNEDAMPGGHTVVADDGSFESPPLDKGETFDHAFDESGSFGFHLKEHPDAKGTVVVE